MDVTAQNPEVFADIDQQEDISEYKYINQNAFEKKKNSNYGEFS